ncbi:MAG TPA: carbonic anhydrase [Alphaproteobacteria bacterium]|nr:carbonic anhydrase [Alphaproteobacteria bacterium]
MSHCEHESIADILHHINPDYFTSFDRRKEYVRPGLMCVACADSRIVPDELFSLPPGEEFLRKPLGGFLPRDLTKEAGLNAWFSLTAGIKKLNKIILVVHSDCAAGSAALNYPSVESIPADHPESNNLRAIQNYLFMIGEDLVSLSEKCREEARGNELEAVDRMTKALAVRTLHNLLGYKVCENRGKTISQAVDDGEIDVSLIYVDLGVVLSTGQSLRPPCIEYYDIASESFRVFDAARTSTVVHVSMQDGHEEECGCQKVAGGLSGREFSPR